MSHEATNWAIKQRGLKPAAKLVLWNLADRHNKDTRRCDPDQTLLAYDCEISRSSLNNQLNILEDAGLIHRVNRVNPKTNRQENTFYILGLDFSKKLDVVHAVSKNCTRKAVSKKEQKPCPKKEQSRVQNLDTIVNPVIKPVIEPIKEKYKSKRSSQFPDDWMPNQKTIEHCLNKDYHDWQIGPMVEDCINHHRGKGNTFKDHDAAFRTWASNQIKFHGTPDIQRRKANGQSDSKRYGTHSSAGGGAHEALYSAFSEPTA